MRKLLAIAAVSILQITACATCAEETKPRAPSAQPVEQPAAAPQAEAPAPAQPPLETSPPNVPELKPAFPQHRERSLGLDPGRARLLRKRRPASCTS